MHNNKGKNLQIDATDHVAPGGLLSRRLFLNSALATTAALATTRAAYGQEDMVGEGQEDWTLYPGSDALEYGERSRFEVDRVRRTAGPGYQNEEFASLRTIVHRARTPHQDLMGTITPSGLHFELTHHGIPDIDPEQHAVVIHGMVKQPLKYNIEALENYPTITREHFLECSGNSLALWSEKPQEWNLQRMHGLLSGSQWTGVPLSTLLDECGVSPDAKWIIAEGADSGSLSRSIPIDKALKDSMIAIYQNGERIRPGQGYPMRLFNPGYEGNTSVKWIRSLHVTDRPAMSRFETSTYTDKMPDGKALQFTLEIDVKSMITRPSNAMSLKKHGLYEITGLAWSGKGKIDRVEVSVDGGKTWAEAALEGPIQSIMLTRFRIPWLWQGEPAILQSRAIDEFGRVQPSRSELVEARGTKGTYHYHGYQSWGVGTNGKISNVYT
ncbi:MAG: sulfite dehydrogenase [Kordiimonadaceae bacterium]|nr:sulfite dehydrogenase [Kordiimonadaceae bacterium]MBT6035218.1 sulfite dehydrogenase [Kordiimonadaceae bacterium]MBT7582226.1 sulfite dehydrogenase [Kordiimonadaceae bacterium]